MDNEGAAKPPPWIEGKETWGYWTLLALALFSVSALLLFHPILGSAFNDHTLSSSWGQHRGPSGDAYTIPQEDSLAHLDNRYVIWQTARGGHALLNHPSEYFEAESCFPNEGSLVYGETGLSLSLMTLPLRLVSGNPIAVFNALVFLLAGIAAIFMYWLVRDWTGVPAAGIVAALIYAFSQLKSGDVVHLNIYDNSWTVLALLFTVRLFERNNWRDGAGLALCIIMQIGESFYTIIGAGLVGLPVLCWLLLSKGPRLLRPLDLVLAGLPTLLIAYWLFSPYLGLQAVGGLKVQQYHYYLPLNMLMPGGRGFSGWVALALAGLGFVFKGPAMLRANLGDPRIALAFAVALPLCFAVGALKGEGLVPLEASSATLWPYYWLAKILPGLDLVRSPAAIYPVAHIPICILAGLGAAGLIRHMPARFVAGGIAALIAIAAIDTMRPPLLGFDEPPVRYARVRTAPEQEAIDFFERLAESGDAGPVLEVPVAPRNLIRGSREVLLSAYHHRATSACYNFAHVSERLVSLGRQLPAPSSLADFYQMGFRTLVLHQVADDPASSLRRATFDRAANAGPQSGLTPLTTSASRIAYRIEPPR
jgi:hypothetical protein